MARPRQKIKRDQQFNVSLTAYELHTLKARAAKAQLRPADFVRWLLLSDRRVLVRKAPPAAPIEYLLHVQVSRIGNNLNQIARRLNAMNIPLPPSLEPLLRDIRALLDRGFRRDH
jgi:hypothetical protein